MSRERSPCEHPSEDRQRPPALPYADRGAKVPARSAPPFRRGPRGAGAKARAGGGLRFPGFKGDDDDDPDVPDGCLPLWVEDHPELMKDYLADGCQFCPDPDSDDPADPVGPAGPAEPGA
jgi:hypothetical protein